MATAQFNRIFQFGPFELDTRSGELRKHGVRIKLQDQPFQILLLLLVRPGEVITREQIRMQLWPENTYVDFDNAINGAVRKLREIVGDSAESPRFIETLARRGYRFIGQLNVRSATEEPSEALGLTCPPDSPELSAGQSRKAIKVFVITGLALMAVLIIWQYGSAPMLFPPS
jgi:DNA-binding winged helix-turn-helix (wHTH) protein